MAILLVICIYRVVGTYQPADVFDEVNDPNRFNPFKCSVLRLVIKQISIDTYYIVRTYMCVAMNMCIPDLGPS